MSQWVYIVTNQHNMTLYVGITNDPIQCLEQHKLGAVCPHGLNKMVFLEEKQDPIAAIEREKQLNRMSRLEKEVLINQQNPNWLSIPLGPGR